MATKTGSQKKIQLTRALLPPPNNGAAISAPSAPRKPSWHPPAHRARAGPAAARRRWGHRPACASARGTGRAPAMWERVWAIKSISKKCSSVINCSLSKSPEKGWIQERHPLDGVDCTWVILKAGFMVGMMCWVLGSDVTQAVYIICLMCSSSQEPKVKSNPQVPSPLGTSEREPGNAQPKPCRSQKAWQRAGGHISPGQEGSSQLIRASVVPE